MAQPPPPPLPFNPNAGSESTEEQARTFLGPGRRDDPDGWFSLVQFYQYGGFRMRPEKLIALLKRMPDVQMEVRKRGGAEYRVFRLKKETTDADLND